MKPVVLHSYLLWRSSVEPGPAELARARLTACASLLPALMVGLFVFGWYAGLVVLTSVLTALVTDRVCRRWVFHGMGAKGDGVWLFTGLVLALFLPPDVPLWVPAAGAILAVALGRYVLAVESTPLLLPVAVGLALAHLLFFPLLHPVATVNGKLQPRWPVLSHSVSKGDETGVTTGSFVRELLGGDVRRAIARQKYRDELFRFQQPKMEDGAPAEAVFGPRPLDLAKEADRLSPGVRTADLPVSPAYSPLDLILGYVPGSIGGASSLALLLGILLLLFTGSISWLTPVVAVLTLAGGMLLMRSPNADLHVLSGYTLLGFFYLLSDPGSTPRSKRGRIIAGLVAGLLEWALRCFSPLSEATFISPLVALGLSFFIDKYVAPPRTEVRQEAGVMSISALKRL